MTIDDTTITIIHSLDEIPLLTTEDEVAEFWETHELSIELWDSLPRVPDALLPPTRPPMPNWRRHILPPEE